MPPLPLRSRSLLLGAAGVLALLAPAARAETLSDAVAAAYDGNPTLRQTRFRLKNADESYVQVRSGYGPRLSLQGEAGYSNAELGGREANSNLGQGYISLSQPLYTGGQLRGQLAAARNNVLSGQESLRLVEIQVVQSVIAAYAAVIRDEARVEVARQNRDALRGQLAENIARRRVEDATLTDVAQADSRLAAGETQLATLEATLAISRSQFVQVVGHNPGTLEPLPDLPDMPRSSDEAYAQAEANNPQLMATKFAEQASSATVASVRGQGLPSVSLNAQAGYTGRLRPFDSTQYQRNLAANVTITQPLFSSGQIRSRIRAATALNNADQAAIDTARRSALQSVTSAWSSLYAARVGLTAGVRQVQSAQLAYAGMQREQRFGLRSTIEVLNAEQELANAQLTLLANRYNEYTARAALLAATGELSAGKLAPGTPLYDPEASFRQVRNKGRTPLEPAAQAIDSIGAARLRRPLSADLTGADVPASANLPDLPREPGPELTAKPLVPIDKSPLVRASDLPGDHLPVHGDLPARVPPAKDR